MERNGFDLVHFFKIHLDSMLSEFVSKGWVEKEYEENIYRAVVDLLIESLIKLTKPT